MVRSRIEPTRVPVYTGDNVVYGYVSNARTVPLKDAASLSGQILMIGDADHAITPAAGVGARDALEDAHAVHQALISGASPADAIYRPVSPHPRRSARSPAPPAVREPSPGLTRGRARVHSTQTRRSASTGIDRIPAVFSAYSAKPGYRRACSAKIRSRSAPVTSVTMTG